MSIGPFYTSSTPAEPALISITTPDGSPRVLTGYTAEGLLFAPDWTDVSAGSFTQVVNAAEGLVQFDWPVPSAFTDAGIYILQIQLTTADPLTLDFSTEVEVEVRAGLPPTTEILRVTTAEVEANTGVAVSTADIRQAQGLIGLFVARNLADDIVWDDISTQDKYWLSLATSHQAAWSRSHPADDTVPVGAVSVKAGDVSVNYGAGGASTETTMLSPLAKMALKRVQWVGNRTIHAKPFLGEGRKPIRPMWEVLS